MLELESDIQVVGEASDGLEAQDLARELLPDIALLDINMPNMDGIDAARELRRTFPAMGIIMLTMFAEEEIIERAIEAGANDYLRKDTPFDDIVSKVRATADGRPKAAPQATASTAPPETVRLTNRNLLSMVVDGLTDSDIAAKVNLSESEVRARLATLYKALGVNDRTQAAIYVITQGMQNVPD
jgi:DNA-binding NarL/FixJ family response regulator